MKFCHSFVPTVLGEIKLEKRSPAENKCKFISQKQDINYDELPCIIPKFTFVFYCFFKRYFNQVCWYKRNDNTS